MKKGKTIQPATAGVSAQSRWTNALSSSLFWFVIIPVFILIIYRPVFSYKLVDWDDKRYLKETDMIQGVTKDHVSQMFTTKVLRSYNPLVLLSFALDYDLTKLDPGWCYAENIFLHIVNALLLFVCLKKIRFRTEMAGFVALLFAVHPQNVEAVAWIAGRKDVLYTFFYLLAWRMYVDYASKNRAGYYFLSLLFFSFSLLSKVQAITFPFVLLITDYMMGIPRTRKSMLNKIPFLLFAIAIGIVGISGGDLLADKYTAPPTMMDKILYSIMAVGLYIQKLFLPFHQTCIYTFPEAGSGEYYFLLFGGIALTGLLLFLIVRTLQSARYVAGGILFFLVSIYVVLHIVAFNSALIYERFTYLAGVGIFISVATLDDWIPSWKKSKVPVLLAASLFFTVLAANRVSIWKNPETMWTDVTEKSPRAAEAFNNLGMVYLDRGDYEKATENFDQSIRIRPNLPDGFNNRSVVAFKKNELRNALDYNWSALKIDSNNTDGLSNRGCYYFNSSAWDSAIYYYSKLTRLSPKNASAWFFLGNAKYNKGNYHTAIQDYQSAIAVVPAYADAYVYMGMCYARLDQPDSVLYCVDQAEKISSISAARPYASKEYLSMGSAIFNTGNARQALDYFRKAAQIQPDNAEAWYDVGGVYFSQHDVSHAREYWKKALAIDPNHKAAKEWLGKIGG